MSKLSKYLPTLCASLFLIFFVAVYAHADSTTCDPAKSTCGSTSIPIKLDNPFSQIGDGGLLGLIKAIVDKIVLPIGGVIAVLSFIWAGFKYVLARGKPAEIQKAHQALLYTVIGTALLLGAYVLTDVISGTITQLGGPSIK